MVLLKVTLEFTAAVGPAQVTHGPGLPTATNVVPKTAARLYTGIGSAPFGSEIATDVIPLKAVATLVLIDRYSNGATDDP